MARNSIKEFDFPLTPIDVNNVTFTPFMDDWRKVELAWITFTKRPTDLNREKLAKVARRYERLAGGLETAEVWMRFLKSQDRF